MAKNLVKVRITRGTTIADPPVFEPGTGDPPTFEIGDVVEVERALAQQLVGNNKAEFYSGTLIEPAPYEKQPKEEGPEEDEEEEPSAVTTASLETEETATYKRPRGRRRG